MYETPEYYCYPEMTLIETESGMLYTYYQYFYVWMG